MSSRDTGARLYAVDNQERPQRITHIRGVEVPRGVLYTPPDVAPQTRQLTPEAERTVIAAFEWAEHSRRDADQD